MTHLYTVYVTHRTRQAGSLGVFDGRHVTMTMHEPSTSLLDAIIAAHDVFIRDFGFSLESRGIVRVDVRNGDPFDTAGSTVRRVMPKRSRFVREVEDMPETLFEAFHMHDERGAQA